MATPPAQGIPSRTTLERATDNAPLPCLEEAAACVAVAAGPSPPLYQELWVRSAGAGGMALTGLGAHRLRRVADGRPVPLMAAQMAGYRTCGRWLPVPAADRGVAGGERPAGPDRAVEHHDRHIRGVRRDRAKATDRRDLGQLPAGRRGRRQTPRRCGRTVVRHALSTTCTCVAARADAPAPVNELLPGTGFRCASRCCPMTNPCGTAGFRWPDALSTVSGIETFHYTVLDLRHFGFGTGRQPHRSYLLASVAMPTPSAAQVLT